MQITEVKVFPISEEKLKAFVSVVFDGCFMVNDIKIINGRDGLFISMPSRRKKNGEFKDVAHPLNNETRKGLEERILGEYERVLEERSGEPAPRRRQPRAAAPSPPATPPQPPRRAPEVPPEAPPVAAAPAVAESAPVMEAKAEEPKSDAPRADGDPEAGRSLEEIEEIHLQDSFWTVS